MTREDIEKELQSCLDEPDNEWDSIFNSGFSRGFMKAANWRINSVWHTTADMPEKWKLCLVEYKDSDGKNKMRTDCRSEYEWVGMCHYDTILRWAYVSDLLPEGGAK